jgi:hypothetical protein
LQDLAVILTLDSKTKTSLFVASYGYACEKAIDENKNTGEFYILKFFDYIQVIIVSFFKSGLAQKLGQNGVGFNLISIGEYLK